jgi:hypothetical protein
MEVATRKEWTHRNQTCITVKNGATQTAITAFQAISTPIHKYQLERLRSQKQQRFKTAEQSETDNGRPQVKQRQKPTRTNQKTTPRY